ncbi:MAG: hypothetical protein PHY12_10960 [Eubacteriales bacterium]|nr:hypothetical protein [Eubacteriales bacterium]
MSNLSDDLRKLAMAGIGAVSFAAEKGKEAVEELSKRGEEAVAQGHVINEQLKHDIKQAVKENVTVAELDKDAVLAALDALTPEERAAVKEKLARMDGKDDEKSDDANG